MQERVICVTGSHGLFACLLTSGPDGLEYVKGTPGTKERIAPVLKEVAEQGAPIRFERIVPGRIDVDVVRISHGDPRFIDGCVAAFRARGWSATAYPARTAEVWAKLHVLPIPFELRASMADRLDQVSSEALDELEAHLDRAIADFGKLENPERS